MGIHYYAINDEAKTFFEPPANFCSKAPDIYNPGSPFSGMFVMMICKGREHRLVCDEVFLRIEKHCDYVDISESVFEEYKSTFGMLDWSKLDEYVLTGEVAT